MTSKERVACVLEGRAPDKVPLNHISISSRIASELLGREACVGGGINQWREAAARWNGPDAHAEFVERTRQDSIDIAAALDHDLVRIGYWRETRTPAERIDEHTFRYESEAGRRWEIMRLDPHTELYSRIDGSDEPETRLENLEALVREEEEAAEEYRPDPEDFPDLCYMLAEIGSEKELRCPGVGTAIPPGDPVWLEAMLLRPDLVGRFLDTQVTRSVRNLELLAPRGARLFFGGGDFASDRGPMYSPQVFHDLLLPRLQRISEAAHRLGVFHFFGTDGNVWPVAEDLYGWSGIDGHYEVDRRAGMDIRKIHERYPHITLHGNISSFTLHTGTPAEVEAETRSCLLEAKETNKVIAGCSNIIISETPMRNVAAMLETISNYR